MEIRIGNEIRVKGASKELDNWCRKELVLENPEYRSRKRRGLWTGKTPEYLWLYRIEEDELVLPVGIGKELRPFIPSDAQIQTSLADNGLLSYPGKVPLYDYQEPAVEAMSRESCGILHSPCGSGKTQMGIALAARLSRKTLWLTHTQDLLTQSLERAAQYFPKELLGTITAGKIHMGSHITFATVQTLSKLSLEPYRTAWDVVIVDECHRLSGTPTQVTMFYRVLNSLAARHKYGLSATVHRSDGLIRSTFAVIGPVIYAVPNEAVKDKIMTVEVRCRETGVKVNQNCLDTDGTLVYSKLLAYLIQSRDRNQLIAQDLIRNQGHFNLILSDRLEHLQELKSLLPDPSMVAMIDGKMTSRTARVARIKALEDLREGRKRYLFATYGLAKEGLDIPRLDRLYLTTPRKDYAVITQSIGRIARSFPGKEAPICYDYVDEIGFCENQYKRRKTSYRKAGYRIVE